MTLESMTGFSSAQGEDADARWVWELKSVNGRGLEVRMRLPPGYEALEAQAKSLIAGLFQRGNISLHLNIRHAETAASLRIDEHVLEMVVAAAETLRDRIGGPPINAETLLGLRGVLITQEAIETPEVISERQALILTTLKTAADQLKVARGGEGAAMASVISDQVAQISELCQHIEDHPARSPDAIRAKLELAVARVLEASDRFDADRLHQEAVLLATRADVEEEIQRLKAHVQAARDLCASGEALGRRLDFLSQEFNREANTICSKANDPELSALGLALKTVIERFREQVQNVE